MPSASHIGYFLLVFTLFCLASLFLVLGAEAGGWQWAKAVVTIGQELGRLIVAATGITFIIVEGGRMLSELYNRARIREGREQKQAEWEAWYETLKKWEQRREDALERGHPFQEPRPEPPSQ